MHRIADIPNRRPRDRARSHGRGAGPIAYWAVTDIRARLDELVAAGAEIAQDVRDVGPGMLIDQVRDAAGSTIGLGQSP